MRTRVFLNLTGKRQLVGVLSSEAGEIAFQYAQDFLTTGLELSPISVPLQKSAWRPQSNLFGGLPDLPAIRICCRQSSGWLGQPFAESPTAQKRPTFGRH